MRGISLPAAAALGILLAWPPFVPSGYPQDAAERWRHAYRDLATLPHDSAAITGVGVDAQPSGFTLVRLGSDDPRRTRVAISGAFDPDGPAAEDIRVLAKDPEGHLHEPSSRSGTTAQGTKHKVVTLACEFTLPESDLREIVVQGEVLVTRIRFGMVSPSIIVDKFEEEKLGIETP